MSFVDTNVLVYATSPAAPQNAKAQTAIIQATIKEPAFISRQIIREYLAAVTGQQDWSHAATISDALPAARTFARLFRVLEDGPSVSEQLFNLSHTVAFGGKQVHDANIVATMLAHGETKLITFNAAHFRRFAHVIEVIEP